MKKIYLSIITLLSASIISQAQTVKVSSNFSNWTGAVPTGWKGSKTNLPNDSVSKITTGVVYGTAAVQLKNAATAHKRFTTQPTNVTQGKAYKATFWVQGNGDVRFGVFDNDLSNGDFGYTYAPYITLNSAVWTMYTQQVVADTTWGTAEFLFSIRNTSPSGSGVIIDSVAIVEDVFTAPSLSVYTIQYTTSANGASDYSGQVVNTGGIVTAFRDFGKGVDKGYYIQSGSGAWSGVWVADSVNTVAKGDSIEITGKVNENFSRTQIEALSAFTLKGQTTAPAATIIPLASAKTEPYEGVLIKVLDVKATNNPDTYGNYVVTDNAGSVTVNVSNQMSAYTADSISANKKYNITGVINYAYAAFSINPRTKYDVEVLTGFKEKIALNTRIYPNPAKEVITLQFNKTMRLANVQLLNVLGETVYATNFTGDILKLDVSKFNQGLYFVNVKTDSESFTARVVIE
ncbi:MAG: T9SS type A sorting domain-containing protein [Bacteroidia bacterium]|nr:T9SS type A sorting domain-containing protein [Bacteroidia bacterium]